jgi:hypothetical protein
VVLEVDEAGILETVEDCFGGLLLLGGVAGEERCEVNELVPLECGTKRKDRDVLG